MNEQPKTKEIPAVSAEEIAITQLTRAVETGFREMRADLGLVSNDLGILKDRVGILESHKNDQDTRATRTSQRVKQVSEQDLEQQAQLAQERVAREALAAKVDDLAHTNATQLAILTRLDAITKNPIVKTIAAMIATAVMTWLATRGIKVPQ